MSRREKALADLRAIQQGYLDQIEQFQQLALVLHNLGPVIDGWRQEHGRVLARIAAIEATLARPPLLQRLLARLGGKTAAQEPTGE